MKIYNINSLINKENYILNPDYPYFENNMKENLYHYFKQLSIPSHVIHIVGVYIQFDINNILYENNPIIYQKFSHHIQDSIEKYLDFGDAELFNMNSNTFFITMFDVLEDNLVLSCLELNRDINKRTFYEHTLHIRFGIYFSHPCISPYQFYQMSKEQFENTLLHDKSLISVKYLSLIK